MYELFNIETSEPDIDPPDGYPFQDELLKDVHNGKISPFVLPLSLYLYTLDNLHKQVDDAFGVIVKDEFIQAEIHREKGKKFEFKKGSSRYNQAIKFNRNMSVFSGAKTFQEVLLLSQNVFNDSGKKVAFNEFLKIGKTIDDQYNKHWLNAEMHAAFRQADGAESWEQVQDDKEILPLLRYNTVGDGRVRPTHVEQDRKIYPVDHPYWDSWFPPNDWNCRCTVDQIEEGRVTTGTFTENTEPVFSGNVGKTGLIFNTEHPYFDVPSKFKKAQRNNFGFGTG